MPRRRLSEDRPCTKCGERPPKAEFDYKLTGRRQSWCRRCTREAVAQNDARRRRARTLSRQ